MAKEYKQPEGSEETTPRAEAEITLKPESPKVQPDPLKAFLKDWTTGLVGDVMLHARIQSELRAVGVDTLDQLRAAQPGIVRKALLAAFRADAHALLDAAHKHKESKR